MPFATHLLSASRLDSISPMEGHVTEQACHDAHLSSCFLLRYRYFVEEKGWVSASCVDSALESDGYDALAIHLACSDEQGVCAYLRALPPQQPWMLDREFAELLTPEARCALPRHNALELSRLVVRGDVAATADPHPIEHLLKALYAFARHHSYDTFYFVVEAVWPLAFRRRFGLPFEIIGQPYCFPDGTKTVLAKASLSQMEAAMQQRDGEKLGWYQAPREDVPHCP